MEIGRLLAPASVALGETYADRAAAIHRLVTLMDAGGHLRDAATFERDVLAREVQGDTDVGHAVAIPHARSAAAADVGLAALTLAEPLPAGDGGEPVRMLFLIAAPDHAEDAHVQVLAALAAVLVDPENCRRLLAAETPQAFCDLLSGAAAPTEEEAALPTYRVLAVTGCPAGLAHTYMAKEALLKEAERLGISLKVETNGAAGVKDPLTPTEIAAAECILIAADTAVPCERFAGKPLFRVPVGEALRHPEALLHRALSDTVPEWEPERPGFFTFDAPRRERLQGLAHAVYTHLMSGIFRMLPFVTGGGILIALAYLLDHGNVGDAVFGQGNQLAWMMRTVGQASFALMYVVLSGFIASSLGDTPAFVPGAMGGYLAWSGMTAAPQESWVSSGIWGAVVAGFGAGLLIRLLTRLGDRLPQALDQAKVTLIYPALSLFTVSIGMVFFVNPPLGRFNDWIYIGLTSLNGGSRLFLCAVLGGLMAIDYGGPVNKAAYLFGTVALMSGQEDIMAAVMVGGMTPSIGIALACLIYPDRFTQAGKRAAPGNFLLGASFVSEGALPYALRDPLRVIPSCMFGSTVAGLLCQWMHCGVPAPHGGLFLLPVMTNPLGFLATLAVGSLLTTLALGVVKPTLSAKAAATPVARIIQRPYPE